MKVTKFTSNEEWLEARPRKVTGTKLKDVTPKERGSGRKIGFYKLAADFLGVPDNSVDGIDRGHELEQEGVMALGQAVGVEFETDLVMWQHDDNPEMAYSPDGYSKDLKTTAEIKCLGSARHLEIIDTNKIPNGYWLQVVQSFIVNEDQETHYFGSYDPRITAKPIHYIETKRADIEDEIKLYRDIEEQVLIDVMEFIERIAF